MFFTLFYLFSIFLSYTDCTKFRVPNITLIRMTIMLLLIGLIEEKIDISSFILPTMILLFFILLLLLKPTMILGGGDIKYMMVVALFLPYIMFPLFLIITGTLQSLALLYTQNIKKRKIVAMVPIMFSSVILTQLITELGYYPLYL
ncbi:MAG: prepilin peptidase [Campylobacterota bacterium]|nr:prepilin peptidase [Campylobacterota bacterium]